MSYATQTAERLGFLATQVSIWGDHGKISEEDLRLLAPLADYFASVVSAIESRRSLHNEGISPSPRISLPAESFDISQRSEATDQKLMAVRGRMNNAR